MTQKLFIALAILLLLTACISIQENSTAPAARADFVTATLAPTRYITWALPLNMETKTPEPTVVSPANCTSGAILLRDVTIPDNTQVTAGEKFVKTWEFQNTGTCPWAGYTMKLSAVDSLNAPASALVADTPPDGKVQVSVELTAPSRDGTYTSYFTLNDPAGAAIPIGSQSSFWVKIVVGKPMVQATDVDSLSSGLSASCAYSQNAEYVAQIASLINQARTEANIPALAVNTQLSVAAQRHSEDMACSNLLSHFGSDGSGFWQRVADTGYFSTHSPSVAEIIAIGTPQAAIDQWRSEAGHWEFVMNPAATEFGVGYAYYANSNFGGYITVDFGG